MIVTIIIHSVLLNWEVKQPFHPRMKRKKEKYHLDFSDNQLAKETYIAKIQKKKKNNSSPFLLRRIQKWATNRRQEEDRLCPETVILRGASKWRGKKKRGAKLGSFCQAMPDDRSRNWAEKGSSKIFKRWQIFLKTDGASVTRRFARTDDFLKIFKKRFKYKKKMSILKILLEIAPNSYTENASLA